MMQKVVKNVHVTIFPSFDTTVALVTFSFYQRIFLPAAGLLIQTNKFQQQEINRPNKITPIFAHKNNNVRATNNLLLI